MTQSAHLVMSYLQPALNMEDRLDMPVRAGLEGTA